MTEQTAAGRRRAAGDADADAVWALLRAAARTAERVSDNDHAAAFVLATDDELELADLGDPDAVITWRPGLGWVVSPTGDERHDAMLDLYLPICGGTRTRPITVGHLGQSLDGFIATHSGESQWVTGRENILHLHRLRALSDAVIVGAGTIATDDPQLTTRLVPGPNPLRVVLDPARRLEGHHRVFNDASAETLYLCSRALVARGETRLGCATIVGIDGTRDGKEARNRGKNAVFRGFQGKKQSGRRLPPRGLEPLS